MYNFDKYTASEILIFLGGTVLFFCVLYLMYVFILEFSSRSKEEDCDILLLKDLRAIRNGEA
jgi:hypothetical protein